MGDRGKFRNCLKYVFIWKCTIKGITFVFVSSVMPWKPLRYNSKWSVNRVPQCFLFFELLNRLFSQTFGVAVADCRNCMQSILKIFYGGSAVTLVLQLKLQEIDSQDFLGRLDR